MTNRILIAAIAGGLALFAWGAVSHMVLGLGSIGMDGIANEDPVLDALRANVTRPGLYYLPWPEGGPGASEAAMKAAEEKAQRGAAFLVYQTQGGGMTPAQLATECGSDVLIALLAAFVLSHIAGSLAFRAFVVALVGLIGGLDVYISYWNWYKFPTNYTMAVMTDQVLGFLLMGFVIAAIVKRPPAA